MPYPSKGQKVCPDCRIPKDFSEFSPFSMGKHNQTRPQGRCLKCQEPGRLKKTGKYKATPEQLAARRDRKRELVAEQRANDPNYLKRQADRNRGCHYGLKKGQFDAMLEAQGGRCGICGDVLEDSRRGKNVEHDHASGKVRSIACAGCNLGLGGFKDEPDRLRKAILYLEKHHPELRTTPTPLRFIGPDVPVAKLKAA